MEDKLLLLVFNIYKSINDLYKYKLQCCFLPSSNCNKPVKAKESLTSRNRRVRKGDYERLDNPTLFSN